MSRNFRILQALITCAAMVVFSIGCSPSTIGYFLFKGDGKAPATYPLKKEGMKEVQLAVLVNAGAATNDFDFADLDRALAAAVDRAFEEQSKGEKYTVKIVDQSKIDRYKQSNPGWRTMKSSEIGKGVGAQFVMDVNINAIALYDRDTGKQMYAGRADLEVIVRNTETGDEVARYSLNSRTDTKFAESVPKSQYKSGLIRRVAEEISWKHLPHNSDQRVPAMQF